MSCLTSIFTITRRLKGCVAKFEKEKTRYSKDGG
jgi:hypothetical protein